MAKSATTYHLKAICAHLVNAQRALRQGLRSDVARQMAYAQERLRFLKPADVAVETPPFVRESAAPSPESEAQPGNGRV